MLAHSRSVIFGALIAVLIVGGGCRAFRAVFDEPPREKNGEVPAPERDVPEPEKAEKKAERSAKGPSLLSESKLTPRERELLREQTRDTTLPEPPLEQRLENDKQNRNWVFGY